MQLKINFFRRIPLFFSKPYLVIIVTLIISVLVGPMLFYNIKNDPRLIPYFDLDEGYGRDLAWYYFSGEKLESFQYSLDYGVEFQMIVDLLVRPLSLFITITPNGILFIIRIFHFICGISALFFLWRFAKYHFPSSWIPTLICLSLLTSPHFVWWLDNIKPEPIVILLMILGLDYTLRIFDNPSWKNVILAVAFSAAAFMVKLIGLFLLPLILLVLFFTPLLKNTVINKQIIYGIIKQLVLILILAFTSFLSFLAIIIPIGTKIYLSKKEESFDLEKFAVAFKPPANLLHFIDATMILLVAGMLILVIWLYRKNKESFLYKKISIIPLFIISSVILGYRWSFNVFSWIITYSRWLHQQRTAPLNFFLNLNISSTIQLLVVNIKKWIGVLLESDALSMAGFILLIAYVFSELFFKPWRVKEERTRFLKRLIILIYCLSFMLFLFLFQSRQAAHHIITIIILFTLLGLEGLRLFFINFKNYKLIFLLISVSSLSLVFSFFYQHSVRVLKSRITKLNQKHDIVYTIGRWWKDNYPYDTKIVADAPQYVYIPSEFKNVVFVMPRIYLDLSFNINPGRIKRIIEEEKPKLIFYNEGSRGGELPPAITQLLKGFRLKKIKEFKGNYFSSYLFTADRFVVYELLNDQ